MNGRSRTLSHGAARRGGRLLVVLCALGVAAGARGQTIPSSPKDFAAAAAASDQYEVMAATTALAQSTDARVRGFAQAMIDAHERLDKALRTAVAKAGLPPPPPAMSADQAALLAGLQNLRGAAFDRTYAAQQVLAHTQAAAVTGSFAAEGADPDLRQQAQAALPTIRDHLGKAQALHEALGGP